MIIERYPQNNLSVLPAITSPVQDVEKEFADFPDFLEFYRANQLGKHLSFFGHKIQKAPFSGAPMLHIQQPNSSGIHHLPWSYVKERLFGADVDKPPSWNLPHGWKYNARGIVNENLVAWKELKPDWKEPVEKQLAGHFFIEVISKKRGVFGMSRHCWIRLIDEKSDVISVGFCGKVLKWLTFRGQKGKLASPDPGELEKGEEICTRVHLTGEEWHKLKTRIEKDQKEKNIYFNLGSRNCSMYVCEILKEIGIDIDNREYPAQALARKIFSKLSFKIPAFVETALHYIAQFFRILLSPVYVLGAIALGALAEDENITEIEEKANREHKPTRPFDSWWSFIDGSIVQIGTGWKVSDWQREVADFREKEMENIKVNNPAPQSKEDEEALEAVVFEAQYELPPHLKPRPLGFAV